MDPQVPGHARKGQVRPKEASNWVSSDIWRKSVSRPRGTNMELGIPGAIPLLSPLHFPTRRPWLEWEQDLRNVGPQREVLQGQDQRLPRGFPPHCLLEAHALGEVGGGGTAGTQQGNA